jgi:hypothetical protein
VSRKATFFFQCTIHKVEGFGEFRWAILHRLLEKIPKTFDADLAVDSFVR